jgi:tRNA pseudouridine32 synthase / 23S rRNA pseudouridine746 synthase
MTLEKSLSRRSQQDQSCFHPLDFDATSTPLPKRFTFPFVYAPDPVAILAAEHFQQNFLINHKLDHSFGDETEKGTGKMFGVLVVKNNVNQLGYLAAFSGKLQSGNDIPGLVPPIFDLLDEEGFYKQGEREINIVNQQLYDAESNQEYITCKAALEEKILAVEQEIHHFKELMKSSKKARNQKRQTAIVELSQELYNQYSKSLDDESIRMKNQLRDLINSSKIEIENLQKNIVITEIEISHFKEKRKQMSALLQDRIFESFQFYNKKLESKNLKDIFQPSENSFPASGAGECAAPKLLQYAFINGFEIVCMAEFWWGKSPNSEVRIHGLFYPACKSKCGPILGHMLSGIKMDENPLIKNPAVGKELPIVYEDEAMVIINKPAEFLSVPGINISDSVATRMKERYPTSMSPLIVHRLDISTSGIMLIAKTKEAHDFLQRQFIKRKIRKKYVAILDGEISQTEGEIDLPIRVDLEDRPRQLVDEKYGKPALTKFKVISISEGKTRIEFFPITGRTHQLRIHSAHKFGLNTPILGDDLYGTRNSRLFLHAEEIEFIHPMNMEKMHIKVLADF